MNKTIFFRLFEMNKLRYFDRSWFSISPRKLSFGLTKMFCIGYADTRKYCACVQSTNVHDRNVVPLGRYI